MPNNSSNNKRIAKNTFFLYGRMLFVLFISIYTTRVVLRELGIVDYGIYNVVCGFVAMFSFFNTTMSSCTQRFYNVELGKRQQGDINIIYSSSIMLQVLIAIVVCIVLETIGLWYVNYKMVLPSDRLMSANWVFQFSTISLLLLFLQVPFSAAVIAYERMNYYAFVSVADAVLKLVIVVALPFLRGDKLICYGLLLVVISLLNSLLYIGYVKMHFKLRFSWTIHKEIFRSLTSFTGWTLLEMFAWMTQGQGVNMVMNAFLGVGINAARGVAMQIQNAIQGFCVNLVTAFRPQIIESYAQGKQERTLNLMYSMSKVMFLFFFLISMPFIIDMDYVLSIWLGDNVPDYASIFSVLMLISMFPRNFVMGFSQIIEATGIVKQYHIWSSFVILIMLPASYWLLHSGCDASSVYWLNIAVCILLFYVCAYLVSLVSPFNLSDYWKIVLRPCLIIAAISIAILLPVKLLLSEGWMRFLIIAFISCLSTLLLGYAFALEPAEKSMVCDSIKRKLCKES